MMGSIGPARFSDPIKFLRSVDRSDKSRPKWKFKNDEVCAFGDIHGDFLVLLSVLTMMKLIDKSGNWTGGSTLVVFCGDLLDRAGRAKSVVGVNPREEVDIIQYLYYLNIQSMQSGGGVVTVLGNHELARVFWKDFEGYSRFTGEQGIAWGDRKVFQPGGLMGKYIARFFPVIVKCNNFIFMHGGPSYEDVKLLYMTSKNSVPYIINKTALMEMSHPGPPSMSVGMTRVSAFTLNRTYGKPKAGSKQEKTCERNIDKLLKYLGVSTYKGGLVIGHTVQPRGGINKSGYCSGKIWRIDLGMSEAFGRKNKKQPIGGLRITQGGGKVVVVHDHPTSL
jgi:hypothetical protein